MPFSRFPVLQGARCVRPARLPRAGVVGEGVRRSHAPRSAPRPLALAGLRCGGAPGRGGTEDAPCADRPRPPDHVDSVDRHAARRHAAFPRPPTPALLLLLLIDGARGEPAPLPLPLLPPVPPEPLGPRTSPAWPRPSRPATPATPATLGSSQRRRGAARCGALLRRRPMAWLPPGMCCQGSAGGARAPSPGRSPGGEGFGFSRRKKKEEVCLHTRRVRRRRRPASVPREPRTERGRRKKTKKGKAEQKNSRNNNSTGRRMVLSENWW